MRFCVYDPLYLHIFYFPQFLDEGNAVDYLRVPDDDFLVSRACLLRAIVLRGDDVHGERVKLKACVSEQRGHVEEVSAHVLRVAGEDLEVGTLLPTPLILSADLRKGRELGVVEVVDCVDGLVDTPLRVAREHRELPRLGWGGDHIVDFNGGVWVLVNGFALINNEHQGSVVDVEIVYAQLSDEGLNKELPLLSGFKHRRLVQEDCHVFLCEQVLVMKKDLVPLVQLPDF